MVGHSGTWDAGLDYRRNPQSVFDKEFVLPKSLEGWEPQYRADGTVICAYNSLTHTLRVNKDLYSKFVEDGRFWYRGVIKGRGTTIELPVNDIYPFKGCFTKDYSKVERLGYLSPEQKKGIMIDKKQ